MAFLVVLAMAGFWALAGWVFLCWAGWQRNLLRAMLLAPAAGMSLLVLLLFLMHRWGMPVRLAGPISTVLLCAAIAAHFWRNGKRGTPPKRLVVRVALVLALGAAFVGAPLLTDGFAWVSFCNDDMANYVLTAQGMLTRGNLALYDPMAYVTTGDPSLQLTAVTEVAGLRCGAELLLSWLMALLGFADHRVFMPMIIALQLATAGAVAGLVCTGRQRRKQAWLVMAWQPLVALVVLGAVYQLIAQVMGLGMLALCATLLLDRMGHNRKTGLAGGLLVGSLGVSYPEVLPFLVLPILLHYGRGLLGEWRWFGTMALTALVAWNTFLTGIVYFFTVQLGNGTKTTPAQQFPYFLIPSGIPTFWGLMPVAGRLEGAWMDAAITIGLLLTVVAIYSIVRQYWRGEAAGAVAASFGLTSALLFARGADFGTYKAAMYLWPFLTCVLVLTWWEWFETRRYIAISIALAAMMVLMGVPTSWRYISASAGWPGKGSGFVEIPGATKSRLLDQLRTLSEQPRESTVVVDTYNVVLAKFAGVYFRGEAFRAPSKNFFATSGKYLGSRVTSWYADRVRPGYTDAFWGLLNERRRWYRDTGFPMPDGSVNEFQLEQRPGETGFPKRYTLLRSGGGLTVLNRATQPGDAVVSLQSGAQVRNHLVLTDSYLGRNYFLAESARPEGRIALFQLEPDYFRPGHTMSSAGRHMLFQVLGPVAGSMMRVEMTASLNGDGENRVPQAKVVGSGTYAFGAVGRGSARLQTAVEPLLIERRPFLLLDMGAVPRGFQEDRRGLQAWYGRNSVLDNRKITSFVRDISLVTAMPQPSSYLEDFRAGLTNPAVLYSGSYEDGWVAEESFYWLHQPAGEVELSLRVNVPDVPTRPRMLQLRVDDEVLGQVPLQLGRQDVRLPVKPLDIGKARRIQLRFDRATPLSADDRRPASALMEALGFRGAGTTTAAPGKEIPASGVTVGNHWYPYEEFGGSAFRWVDHGAEVFLTSRSAGSGKLIVELEAGPGVGSKAFRLLVRDDAGKTVNLDCHGGRDKYPVTLNVKPGKNRFRLGVEGGGLPTPNDPRVLHFRVFGLEWKPAT